MFDQRNDPVHLLHSLKTFLRVWHDDLQDWYGIAPEKLAATPLPDPLRRLYTFAGNCPGENFWCSPFAHQDYLLPFELLYQSEDRLHFAGENQGCWTCCTALEGDDPPVWFREGNENWQLLEDTLAQFLVTLCLHKSESTLSRCGPPRRSLVAKRSLSAADSASFLSLCGPGVDHG
jgi:hypothetical protein